MTKRILLTMLLLGTFTYSPTVHAQLMPPGASLKITLADFLYQYGKELYNRGLDMQEASFVFQRALVLDCHHKGAQDFLNKLHAKYPDISIRIWGCKEEVEEVKEEPSDSKQMMSPKDTDSSDEHVAEPSKAEETEKAENEEAPETTGFQVADDVTEQPAKGELKDNCQKLRDQIKELEKIIKQKDNQIRDYKQQLSLLKSPNASKAADDVAFSSIAQDQKDLIRVQQGNIDYLKSELVELKKQMQGSGPISQTGTGYAKAQRQVADSGLEVQEAKSQIVSKDQDIKTLQQKLEDLQEELKLVQKIVDEKNKMIQVLQERAKQ